MADDLKEPLDPLQLLQEDLRDDDYEQAIASVKRLHTIGLALGPERTRGELIPYLMEYCELDNDEAHTAIAEQMAGMVDLVGREHTSCLLPVLEKLAGEEECVVRNAAVKSLNALAPVFNPADYVAVVKRLANGDWFTTRVSASSLFADCYRACEEGLPQTCEELRSLYQNLCADETPMVRKAAHKHLGAFAIAVKQHHFKTDLLPLLVKIAQDDVDSMRVLAIAACVDLCVALDEGEFTESVVPIIEALQDDASWKVRKSLAEALPDICARWKSAPALTGKMLPFFAKLLKDKEAEVRTAAAKVLAPVCTHVKQGLVDHILPVLPSLATDQSQNVRAGLSKGLGDLFTAFGKETSQKLLLPLLQQLAQDEAAEVRNNVTADLHLIAECLGPAALGNALLPMLIELAKDQKWRVRMAVVEKAAFIAKCLGVSKFEAKMQQIVINCLTDHVFTIRETCCKQVGLIVKEFGGQWASENFFKEAFRIYNKQTNYLHRMTCLLIIMNCAGECPPDVIEANLLEYVIKAAEDEVPNVKLAAAKAMEAIIPNVDVALTDKELVPHLENLEKDEDCDVAFFARSALNVRKAM